MGILAIQYQTVPETPVLVALNREENPARLAQPPRIQSGRPRIVCGIDKKTGGTWAGVNQHGLFVAVVNAWKRNVPFDPRSRGVLCKELLYCQTAEEALELGLRELETGCYAGANYLCVDRTSGGVLYGGNEIGMERLKPGLHLLTENRLDDRTDFRQEFVRRLLTLQRIGSPVAFLALASKTFARKPDIEGKRGVVLTGPDLATVSSILLSLATKNQRSIMQFSNGAPSDKAYEDISALLRQVLSTDRAAAKQGKGKDGKKKEGKEKGAKEKGSKDKETKEKETKEKETKEKEGKDKEGKEKEVKEKEVKEKGNKEKEKEGKESKEKGTKEKEVKEKGGKEKEKETKEKDKSKAESKGKDKKKEKGKDGSKGS